MMQQIEAATVVTGARQMAERSTREECGMRAAVMAMRLINEGWTMTRAEYGYTLTPPAAKGMVR